MSERGRNAFVTLATNDTYSLGCLVLGNSLRRVDTSAQLVVMVTTGVSNSMRSQLSQVFNVIQEVNVLDSNDPINLSLLGRPDLNVTFTKLHCWRLTQFDKAVFLDADTLILQNVDELFDREELSAAPDAGWPDCFNSGVFVFKPSLETYQSLLDFATSQGSFDGGDQGLLNMYYKNWSTDDISKHLPFIYNVVSQAFYSYLPAFTQFKDRVKIVHFIGAVKPWHHTYDTNTKTVKPLPGTGHSQEFLQVWWNIFMQTVQPSLDPNLAEELTVVGLVGELASMAIQGQPGSFEAVSDAQRKLNWERGQIDYLGQDSFENIQRKIDETMSTESSAPVMSSPFTPKSDTAVAIKPKQEVVVKPKQEVVVAPEPTATPATAPKPAVTVTAPKPTATAPKPTVTAPAPKPTAPKPTATPTTAPKPTAVPQPTAPKPTATPATAPKPTATPATAPKPTATPATAPKPTASQPSAAAPKKTSGISVSLASKKK